MLPRVAARPALQHGIIATPRAPSTGFRLEIAALRVFVIFLGAILNQPLATLGVVALEMNVEEVRRILIFRRPPPCSMKSRGAWVWSLGPLRPQSFWFALRELLWPISERAPVPPRLRVWPARDCEMRHQHVELVAAKSMMTGTHFIAAPICHVRR
jgi:hypothetical protein